MASSLVTTIFVFFSLKKPFCQNILSDNLSWYVFCFVLQCLPVFSQQYFFWSHISWHITLLNLSSNYIHDIVIHSSSKNLPHPLNWENFFILFESPKLVGSVYVHVYMSLQIFFSSFYLYKLYEINSKN
jgi:hypothetical protein